MSFVDPNSGAVIVDPATGLRRAAVSAPSFAYVDWPAIFSGTFVALAVSLIMLTFGSALGLSMVSAEPSESASIRWIAVTNGLWFVWVVISSVGAGAYLAGRLRHPIGDALEDEIEVRDGSQGLVVWALSVLLGVFLAANGVANLTGAVAQTGASVAGGVAGLVEEPLDVLATNVVRDPTGAQVTSSVLVDDAAAILTRSVTEGEMTDADRTYLSGRIVAESGQSSATVDAGIDEAMTAAQSAWDSAQAAIEAARRASILAAFVIGATLLVAGATGYFAAVTGGKHRDDNIPLRTLRRS